MDRSLVLLLCLIASLAALVFANRPARRPPAARPDRQDCAPPAP